MAESFEHRTSETLARVQAQAQSETVGRQTRRWREVLFQAVLIAALSIFSILAVLARSNAYFPVDLFITRAFQEENTPILHTLMVLVSWPGYVPQANLVVALLLLALYLLGFKWEAVSALFAALLTNGLNLLVKFVIARPRPSSDLVDVFQNLNSYSFPSGHVMFYTGFFGFVTFLSFVLLKHSWARAALVALFSALVLLVGPSRIFLGEHWASDVLGAYLLGGLCLVVVIRFYHWGKERRFFDG